MTAKSDRKTPRNYGITSEIMHAMAALNKELAERKFDNDLIENAMGHMTNALSAGTKREKQ